MKKNGFVSNREVQLSADSVLVSKTDLKGVITYCNSQFVRISGFKKEELLGKSHNVVRHPDMPPAAFEDLWNHLQANRPWSGIVKNRAKNGDHYWVKANITPVMQGDRVVEYMSVRTAPSQEEIQNAEQLYGQNRKRGTSVHRTSLLHRSGIVLSKVGLSWPMLFGLVSLLASIWLLFSMAKNDGTIVHLGLITTTLLSTLAAMVIARANQVRDIQHLSETLAAMAGGDYFRWNNFTPSTAYRPLYEGIYSLQIRQGYESMNRIEVATKGLRIQTALDSVKTNVMIADEDNNIIYLNKALLRMFTEAETDLKAALPHFDASKLIGANMDQFHQHPHHQRGLIQNLRTPHQAEVQIGPRHFGFIAIPVVDDNGIRTGTVVEWQDRTEQVRIESEVQTIVEQAQNGNLTHRIKLHDKDGFFHRLSEEINQSLDINETVINEALHALDALSRGDLTHTMRGEYGGSFDQLKQAVNTTLEHLNTTVGKIRQTTRAVNAGVLEISRGNEDLARRTNLQAVALEESAASTEEISGTMQQTASNALQANEMTNKAKEIAEHGGKAIAEAIESMTEVEKVSQEISEISDLIDSIAFQTNLLALNAAVEAAHAGEEGRGFAVVATEVRTLAQRSAESAKTIQDLIKNSVSKIHDGTEKVRANEAILKDIITASQQARDVVHEISEASLEQATGVQEINNRLIELDRTTQENASLVQETATSSTVLSDQSYTLEQLVEYFTVEDRTNREHHHSAAPKRTADFDFV